MAPALPHLIGINHVALEVGDLEEAISFFGSIFELRGVEREPGMAFLDMGDQFLALSEGRTSRPDTARHFGLVVDDKQAVRELLETRRVKVLPGPLDFLDPWGNHIQIVDYRDIQFTKAPAVLNGMGFGNLRKHPKAVRELADNGLA